ncbi:YbhB/YbcL family Raf kinase inhibitor-like protein [Xylophilus sp. GW821-FHT01B05]
MLENLPDALGHVLRHHRAGLDALAFHHTGLRSGLAALDVRSLAFADHAPIPALYTADGEGLSPPLQWTGVPSNAASLLLIVEDADAPTPKPLVQAIVVGLPPQDGALAEGAFTHPAAEDKELRLGRNSYLFARWLPPDPPPGHGAHRYAFQLFALDAGADFGDTPGREAVLEAVQAHGLASGMLIGTYTRPDGSIRVKDARPVAAAS